MSSLAQGYAHRDNAFTLAYLKRALDHLHKTQAGLEAVAPKTVLPNEMLIEARQELLEIRQGILNLMHELRSDPSPTFDSKSSVNFNSLDILLPSQILAKLDEDQSFAWLRLFFDVFE